MNKIARKHHFLSQCYLRGFTENGSKKSKFLCFDLKNYKSFFTKPEKTAHERDFNLLNFKHLPSDYLETSLADFESFVSKAIKNTEKTQFLGEEDKIYALNLIALFAIRNPSNRDHWDDNLNRLQQVKLGLMVSDEKIWRANVEKLRAGGVMVDEDISYQECKDFVNNKP